MKGSNNRVLRDTTGDCSFFGDHIFNVHLQVAVSQVDLNLISCQGWHFKSNKEKMMVDDIECLAEIQGTHVNLFFIGHKLVEVQKSRKT